jgi:hypothetical protein
VGTEPADYCREIEAYLCRKNDGHLIRVVGPSFDLVSAWERQGIPIKVAFTGIDRCFERYYRQGPRRRPVKIDFCEADVLDVFDEWRRAVGVTQASVTSRQSPVRSRQSLPEHLERALTRLTSARAGGLLGAELDPLIDRVSHELDGARTPVGGVRGEARQAMIARLADLDAELLAQARATLDAAAQATLTREADEELAPFRAGMAPDAYARAREAAIDRLVRERCSLPTIAFGQA